MTDESRTVLVLRRGVHGMPVEEYADELQARLPESDVRVAKTPHEEEELIRQAEVVTGQYIDESLLEKAEALRLFACTYAGTDHLPMTTLKERGVAVTNASGVHGPNVAEYVIGSILAFVRRLDEGWRREQNHEWRHFQAHELQGSTVTIVGLGAIGTAIVERLAGFGVETIGVRYRPDKDGPTDRVVGFDSPSFDSALARTDYLVLVCPLTRTTRGLIDATAFETLSPDAVVVNVARGPVIETADLVSALQGNQIRGAALDVTDPEPLPSDHVLWELENCRITPHNAGHTPAYYERTADIVARNLESVDRTGSYDDLDNQVVD